jgi:hypothetical protein
MIGTVDIKSHSKSLGDFPNYLQKISRIHMMIRGIGVVYRITLRARKEAAAWFRSRRLNDFQESFIGPQRLTPGRSIGVKHLETRASECAGHSRLINVAPRACELPTPSWLQRTGLTSSEGCEEPGRRGYAPLLQRDCTEEEFNLT